MSVSTRALTTRDRATEFMDLSGLSAGENTVLDNIIDACTDWVESYCRRKFVRTAFTEYYDGTDDYRLMLRHYPIVTGESIALAIRTSGDSSSDFSTVSRNDYFVKDTEGHLEFPQTETQKYGGRGRRFLIGTKRYRVGYTAGYYLPQDASYSQGNANSLPVDLEYAVWKLIATAWSNRRGGENVISERIGQYQVTFAKEAFEDERILDILNKYARIDSLSYSTYVS